MEQTEGCRSLTTAGKNGEMFYVKSGRVADSNKTTEGSCRNSSTIAIPCFRLRFSGRAAPACAYQKPVFPGTGLYPRFPLGSRCAGLRMGA